MFNHSQTTEKLDAALAKAQAEIQVASKDKKNPAFNSKYADLTAVWDACRDALTKHGISVTQWPVHSEDSKLHLVTRLACQGEWISAQFSIPVSKDNAHGYGSAITYAKRFALAAAVGVVADEDDDGNAAAKAAPAKTETPKASSADSIARAAWKSMNAEQQQTLREKAIPIKEACGAKNYEDAWILYDRSSDDADERAALWYLFVSEERSPMKAARDRMRAAAKSAVPA